jgi:hypothetical protein
MKKLITCLVGAMLILNLIGCGTLVLAQTAKAAGETKLVLDFEDTSIWMSENDNPFTVQKK